MERLWRDSAEQFRHKSATFRQTLKKSGGGGYGGYGGMVERFWRNYSREQHFAKAKRYAIISPDLEAV